MVTSSARLSVQIKYGQGVVNWACHWERRIASQDVLKSQLVIFIKIVSQYFHLEFILICWLAINKYVDDFLPVRMWLPLESDSLGKERVWWILYVLHRPVSKGGSRGFAQTPLLISKRFYIHRLIVHLKCPTFWKGPLVLLLLRITAVHWNESGCSYASLFMEDQRGMRT